MTEKQDASGGASTCDVCGDIGPYPITVSTNDPTTACEIEHRCVDHLPVDDESTDAPLTTKQMDAWYMNE